MTRLPKRVPGAHLPQPGPTPEGGWFGTSVQWPTEDPDAGAAARYLRDCGLPEGPEADALLHHVLDGLRHLYADADR
jgi:hypothetical protein